MSTEMNRRDLFRTFGTLALGSVALQLTAGEPNAPLFFSPSEYSLLDTLTEMIIPTDDHSPGAHAAGVAKFIDFSVAGSIDPDEKKNWTKGLELVNSLSQRMNQSSFREANREQQVAVLKSMSKNEDHPSTEAERFWGQLKQTTAFAYYTTAIGIHQEMNYKGNVILEQFVGYDAT